MRIRSVIIFCAFRKQCVDSCGPANGLSHFSSYELKTHLLTFTSVQRFISDCLFYGSMLCAEWIKVTTILFCVVYTEHS